MSNLPPEIATLAAEGRFARFLKVDLHVHTPAAPWCWNQHKGDGPAAGTLSPVDVANAIIATDVDIVAITDHDTVVWTENVIRETKRVAKKSGRRITVLPGVEITTYDGVHLLAIFGQDTPIVDIANMLKAFELKADGVNTERASSNWPVDKVASKIEQTGGIVIAPHANDRVMGIWGGEKSAHKGKRTDWMRDGVAKILACAPDQIGGLAAAIRNSGVDRRFAFIRHSDAHGFAAIGTQATYIKLAEPSIEGLRQVIHEPELRVAFVPPTPPTYPRILGMEIDGGYFTKERLAFSDHLNTLIGGNYSGKSAVVDALRFVFDDQCFGDATEQRRLLDRIDGIMGNGTIRVWLVGADGSYYRAERRAIVNREKRGQLDRLTCSVEPVVTKLDGKVELSVDSRPRDVLPIDFYGQGSVSQVAKFAEKHRELIDAMAGIALDAKELAPETEDKGGIVAAILDKASAIETTTAELAKIDEELEALPGLKDQLTKLEAQAQSPLLKEWGDWQNGHQEMEGVKDYLRELETPADADEIVAQLLGDLPEMSDVSETIDATLLPLRKAMAKLNANAVKAAAPLSAAMAADVKACIDAVAKWEKLFTQKRDAVHTTLRELKLGSEEALLKRISELKKQIARVEKRRSDREKSVKQLERLEGERAKYLRDLRRKWDDIRIARRRVVDHLNAATGPEVAVTYALSVDRTTLATRLDTLMRDHGTKDTMVQRRERQIAQIVAAHDAASLVSTLRTADATQLVASASVTLNTAQFLCDLPLRDLLSLDLCIADDHVEITYRRPGESDFTELGRLSPGERAVVLLTVAFAGGEGPLVIDQPEDELGQALVTADIVDTIRRRKAGRQFVVVTHNANIPVLGDAEGVFCMINDVDPNTKARRCQVKHTGAIECEPIKSALLGLEGGRDSFLKRQERYHIEQ